MAVSARIIVCYVLVVFQNYKRALTSERSERYDEQGDSLRYIRHLGYDFGCKIETKKPFLHANYHWHYLRNVKKHGVADQMKLQAGDELVLLDRQFTPEWPHGQVMDQLGGVPVDGKTRFSLVLLRRTQGGKLEWVVSSAILGVDYGIRDTDRKVIVKHLQYKTVEGLLYDDIRVYRLKVKGTGLYLKIQGGEVELEVAKATDIDRYDIHVWTKVHLDEMTGRLSYTACLYGDNVNLGNRDDKQNNEAVFDGMATEVSAQNDYVTVSGGSAITVTDTPQWFGYREKRRGMSFEVKELFSWIACEVREYGTSGSLCIKPNEFFFESYVVGREKVNSRM